MDARIENYKATYRGMYGHEPPTKCVESFCRINKIEPDSGCISPVPEDFWREDPLDG